MKFETPVQQACYEKIQPWLHDLYENVYSPPYNMPVFVLPLGSATATIEVLPWGTTEAIISTWSYVVTGVEMTQDLMKFLLQKNAEIDFGVFSIDDDGDIRFHTTLIGSTCDRDELKTSVSSVLETADLYDDAIVVNWGGERALERSL
jgi:hypothetical protein